MTEHPPSEAEVAKRAAPLLAKAVLARRERLAARKAAEAKSESEAS